MMGKLILGALSGMEACFHLCSETASHSVAWTGLKFPELNRLALPCWDSPWVCFLGAGITVVCPVWKYDLSPTRTFIQNGCKTTMFDSQRPMGLDMWKMVKEETSVFLKIWPTHVSSKLPGLPTLYLIVMPILGIKSQFLNLWCRQIYMKANKSAWLAQYGSTWNSMQGC